MTDRRTVWDFATAALREQSPSVLRGGLIWLLRAYDGKDPRDLMLGLAPFHDCARRLGLDVGQIFNDAADTAGGEGAQVARDFGRRSDVTPEPSHTPLSRALTARGTACTGPTDLNAAARTLANASYDKGVPTI